MGYACDHVDSGQDSHLAEYTCAICCSLVDAPLLTTCHHVFCTGCLQACHAGLESKPQPSRQGSTHSDALRPGMPHRA